MDPGSRPSAAAIDGASPPWAPGAGRPLMKVPPSASQRAAVPCPPGVAVAWHGAGACPACRSPPHRARRPTPVTRRATMPPLGRCRRAPAGGRRRAWGAAPRLPRRRWARRGAGPAPPRTRPPRLRRWEKGARVPGRARPGARLVLLGGAWPPPARRSAVPGPRPWCRRGGRWPSRNCRSGPIGARPWRRACSRRGMASAPGAPKTAAQSAGATTASTVFSATDSTTARARPFASRPDGSRPTRAGSNVRARSRSPASRASATSLAASPRPRPATVSAVAPAVERSATPDATPMAAPVARWRTPAARPSAYQRASAVCMARPNQATGCTGAGGSPSTRSASTPRAAWAGRVRPTADHERALTIGPPVPTTRPSRRSRRPRRARRR